MRRKIALSACVFVVGLASVRASATIVLNETFDGYTNGNLVGQGGWLQTSTTTTNPIQVTGGTNKVVSLVTSGQDVYDAFSQPIPHTAGNFVETDMTINVSAAQATGDYFAHLSDPPGTTSVFVQRLGIESSSTGYVLGLEPTAGGGGAFTYGTTVLPFGTNEAIDIIWNFAAGTTSDTFAVSVNGVTYPGLANVAWGSTVAEPAQISAANLRQGTASAAPTLTVDNYEVQGTVAVPEPASMGILLATGGMLLSRRSRRA